MMGRLYVVSVNNQSNGNNTKNNNNNDNKDFRIKKRNFHNLLIVYPIIYTHTSMSTELLIDPSSF